MPSSSQRALKHTRDLLAGRPADDLLAALKPRSGGLPARVPGASVATAEAVARRWALVAGDGDLPGALWNGEPLDHFGSNAENLIGSVAVPLGLAGPLRVNGTAAAGDYYVPLATTEAALVASFTRGCRVVSESGGCAAVTLAEGVTRAPGFIFRDVREVGEFVLWLVTQKETFATVAGETTSHGQLVDMRVTVEGNHVYVSFEFTTGDAAGQNMVTIATQAICDHIRATSPVAPQHVFVEANLSGDKKASSQSFQSVRGRKVVAEVVVPAEIIARRLHTSAGAMEEYWRMSALGGVLSGTIGVQGHYANGLAALFLATGQDVACVSEAAVGVTRFENRAGDLYAAVTLPNVIVGTVGGGTGLPAQAACLRILGLAGSGHARALAEVATALALAGELSIIAALCAGDFTRAHKKLARRRAVEND